MATTARVKGSRARNRGAMLKLNPLVYRSSNVEILDAEDDDMGLLKYTNIVIFISVVSYLVCSGYLVAFIFELTNETSGL